LELSNRDSREGETREDNSATARRGTRERKRGTRDEKVRGRATMRRSSKKSSSSSAAAGEEQVNEKQNRKRKGVSTNLTSRKAQRVPTKAVSKEIERIDQLFYTYADGSSSMIE
uniref:Uncharacterized protein n=1 Tax=Triticum urartu TaxID=4572 RepID=A0A8R7R4I0_TRIUA